MPACCSRAHRGSIVHSGRTDPNQITIYGGGGLAFQNLAAAWHVYQKARHSGVGHTVDFLMW